MLSAWIKQYLPRHLFGRAVLIFLVPILALQLVVSIIIVQRIFDGVTTQLARGVALEIAIIAERIENAGGPEDAATAFASGTRLNMGFTPGGTVTPGFHRHWWDRSGRVIKPTMDNVIARPLEVDLTTTSLAALIAVEIEPGTLSFKVSRARMSAANPQQLIILMFAASVLLSAVALIFLKNQVRPIRRLAHAADSFGKGQVVTYQPSGAEEVRRAGSAFLAMRSRIERQIEQRTLMLSGVSHDLRTPLTRMRLALATAETQEDLAALEDDITDMERMLNEFLAFARGDSGEKSKRIHSGRFTTQIAEECSSEGAPVELVLDQATGGQETVTMREMAVRRALVNLLNNAARYGSQRRLSRYLSDTAVTFVVEDNGPSIPAETREEALKPFARLDQSRNQDKGSGVGLGLAIALDIARSHGGALTLDDSPDLGGLRAAFTIPR